MLLHVVERFAVQKLTPLWCVVNICSPFIAECLHLLVNHLNKPYTVSCSFSVFWSLSRVQIGSVWHKNVSHYAPRNRHTGNRRSPCLLVCGSSSLCRLMMKFLVLPESQNLIVPPVSTRLVMLYRFYRVGKLTFGTDLIQKFPKNFPNSF